ncbi:hypothetical protein M0R72_02795 [Candidatus Pacearchaeota archaeon]|jgi:hypothetical protein|nr:hypothetical protein [Candidatus Pacearchaeota archaeon]
MIRGKRMDDCTVTILNNEFEYKPTLRQSIASVFQAIKYEVYSIIEFLGYTKEDYVLNPYPLTIQRVDGLPVSQILLGCIRSRLGGRPDLIS